MRDDAEGEGIHTLRVEATENRSLPAILAPELRQSLLRLSRYEKAKEGGKRALRALAGLAKALKVKFQDIEVGVDFDPEPGLADNGNLDHDLSALLEVTGEAAQQAGKVLAIFVDELHCVKEDELASLIVSLHRISQRRLPVILLGAGLPQLRGRIGRAKPYAERLFEFPTIGKLHANEVRLAITKPLRNFGADITEDALESIIDETQCYPYFVQEWGKHSWDAANRSLIELIDVRTGAINAVSALDQNFFGVRFDRLTPFEKVYLRAMAELGPGPYRSGDVAKVLAREPTSLGHTRNRLITKGMIWSPTHGHIEYTVPLFDDFLLRIMKNGEWKS
jgi:hypothetical protein